VPCHNCGAELTGPYCSQCGQSVEDGEATTITHLLQEATQEVSNVDGKVLRTVAALLARPGRLTAQYWAGRRASWIRPLKIFLLAAALHFVAAPGIGPMNLDMLVQRAPDGGVDISIGTAARSRAGQKGMVAVAADEQAAYAARMRDAYEATRYVAPVLFALASWGIYRRRQPFLANHIVMAAHFYAFWYLVAAATGQLGAAIGGGWLAAALSWGYLCLMLRHLFGDPWGHTLWKTAVLYVSMVVIEMGLALAAALWVLRAP
jgi:hypothetical protein